MQFGFFAAFAAFFTLGFFTGKLLLRLAQFGGAVGFFAAAFRFGGVHHFNRRGQRLGRGVFFLVAAAFFLVAFAGGFFRLPLFVG